MTESSIAFHNGTLFVCISPSCGSAQIQLAPFFTPAIPSKVDSSTPVHSLQLYPRSHRRFALASDRELACKLDLVEQRLGLRLLRLHIELIREDVAHELLTGVQIAPLRRF